MSTALHTVLPVAVVRRIRDTNALFKGIMHGTRPQLKSMLQTMVAGGKSTYFVGTIKPSGDTGYDPKYTRIRVVLTCKLLRTTRKRPDPRVSLTMQLRLRPLPYEPGRPRKLFFYGPLEEKRVEFGFDPTQNQTLDDFRNGLAELSSWYANLRICNTLTTGLYVRCGRPVVHGCQHCVGCILRQGMDAARDRR